QTWKNAPLIPSEPIPPLEDRSPHPVEPIPPLEDYSPHPIEPIPPKKDDEKEKELAKMNEENAKTKQELAETKQELAETKQELAETKQALAETKPELAETKPELAEMEQEISDLRVVVFSVSENKKLCKQTEKLKKLVLTKGKDAGASGSSHTDKKVGSKFSPTVIPSDPTGFAQKVVATDMSQGPENVETCKQVGANNGSEMPRHPISLKTGEDPKRERKSRTSVPSRRSRTVHVVKEPEGETQGQNVPEVPDNWEDQGEESEEFEKIEKDEYSECFAFLAYFILFGKDTKPLRDLIQIYKQNPGFKINLQGEEYDLFHHSCGQCTYRIVQQLAYSRLHTSMASHLNSRLNLVIGKNSWMGKGKGVIGEDLVEKFIFFHAALNARMFVNDGWQKEKGKLESSDSISPMSSLDFYQVRILMWLEHNEKRSLLEQNKILREDIKNLRENKFPKGKDAGASGSPQSDKLEVLKFSDKITPLGEGSPTGFDIPAQKVEATDMSQGPKNVETCEQVEANNGSEMPRDPKSLKTGEDHNYDSKRERKSRTSVPSRKSRTVHVVKEPEGISEKTQGQNVPDVPDNWEDQREETDSSLVRYSCADDNEHSITPENQAATKESIPAQATNLTAPSQKRNSCYIVQDRQPFKDLKNASCSINELLKLYKNVHLEGILINNFSIENIYKIDGQSELKIYDPNLQATSMPEEGTLMSVQQGQ
ncbi:hypothetical protein MAR_020348, partial [Mya arenaria]